MWSYATFVIIEKNLTFNPKNISADVNDLRLLKTILIDSFFKVVFASTQNILIKMCFEVSKDPFSYDFHLFL